MATGEGVAESSNQPAIGPGFSTRPTTATASRTTTASTIEAAFGLEKNPGPVWEGPSPGSVTAAAAALGAAGGRAPADGCGTAGRAVFKGTEAFPYDGEPPATGAGAS